MLGPSPLCHFELSASIVAYKSDPGEVRSAAESFLSTPLSHKLTVIDNSPDDGLSAHLAGLPLEYRFSGQNLGYGGGHNQALRSSIGFSRYHVVINPDIRFQPGVLDELHRFMEEHPEVGLVMPRILYPDGTDQNLCKLLPSPADLILRRFFGLAGRELFRGRWERYELKDLDRNKPREVPYLSGCFMFIRTSVLRQTGLFDERFFMYMEDVDLCRRIGAQSKTAFFPSVSVTHGYAKGSYRSLSLLYHHVLSAIRYFSKWGWMADPERRRLNRRAGTVV